MACVSSAQAIELGQTHTMQARSVGPLDTNACCCSPPQHTDLDDACPLSCNASAHCTEGPTRRCCIHDAHPLAGCYSGLARPLARPGRLHACDPPRRACQELLEHAVWTPLSGAGGGTGRATAARTGEMELVCVRAAIAISKVMYILWMHCWVLVRQGEEQAQVAAKVARTAWAQQTSREAGPFFRSRPLRGRGAAIRGDPAGSAGA